MRLRERDSNQRINQKLLIFGNHLNLFDSVRFITISQLVLRYFCCFVGDQ